MCQLIVPFQPLSYIGLTTPYQLQGCDMRATPSFVEAVIFDLDRLEFSVYHPLVINAGTTPLSPLVTFTMPKNSVVGVWFGSNAQTLTLAPPANIQECVYNIGGMGSNDVFGQFAHCGAINFFEVVSKYIENISVPALGKASDGENCLTTRDFGLVDMDPADNVVTTYLVDPATGRTAQNSAVNQAVFTNTVVLKNGSDNLLLSTLDMVMGCKPFRVRNLVDINNPVTGGLISSMALDEIHAALRQTAPYAYLPKGDPMVRIGGLPNLAKLNAYRQGVFQPMVSTLEMAGTLEFCAHMTNVQLPRLQKNRNLFAIEPSPDMAVATNLFAFLANRFAGSFTGLNCGALLDIAPPVQVVMMGTVVTDATISIPAVIPTGSDDPYLINWRDYPGLDPTPVPTTPAPTTAAPTTPVPTTPVPTTPVPTTPVPTTPVPTTAAPTTAAPTTPVPTTPVPTTAAPTTAVPAASQSQMVVILSSMIAVFIIAGVVAWLKNCFVKKKEDGDYSEMQKV